jgi:hypothetical protein
MNHETVLENDGAASFVRVDVEDTGFLTASNNLNDIRQRQVLQISKDAQVDLTCLAILARSSSGCRTVEKLRKDLLWEGEHPARRFG